jgi:DNA gyrase/topoisomerase IV subunit B
MYVADTGLAGAHQLLREVLSNSVDEYLGGHATRVVVKLEGDGVTFEVSDNGRGIPVDIHPKTKQPAHVYPDGCRCWGEVFQRQLQGFRWFARSGANRC